MAYDTQHQKTSCSDRKKTTSQRSSEPHNNIDVSNAHNKGLTSRKMGVRGRSQNTFFSPVAKHHPCGWDRHLGFEAPIHVAIWSQGVGLEGYDLRQVEL